MVISFGVFQLRKKSHIRDVNREDKYRLVFEDTEEKSTRLSIAVGKEDFERLDIGDYLPWEMTQKQSTLKAKKALPEQ